MLMLETSLQYMQANTFACMLLNTPSAGISTALSRALTLEAGKHMQRWQQACRAPMGCRVQAAAEPRGCHTPPQEAPRPPPSSTAPQAGR